MTHPPKCRWERKLVGDLAEPPATLQVNVCRTLPSHRHTRPLSPVSPRLTGLARVPTTAGSARTNHRPFLADCAGSKRMVRSGVGERPAVSRWSVEGNKAVHNFFVESGLRQTNLETSRRITLGRGASFHEDRRQISGNGRRMLQVGARSTK